MSFIEETCINYSRMLTFDTSPEMKTTCKYSNDSGYFSSPLINYDLSQQFGEISDCIVPNDPMDDSNDITSILAAIPKCSGCGQCIFEKEYFQIKDDTWHEKCLQCCECLTTLKTRAYIIENSVYCKDHFLPTVEKKCTNCKHSVSLHEAVRRAGENIYHVHCFKCLICNKSLNTGDPFYLTKDNKLVCDENHDDYYSRDDVDNTETKRPRSIITNKQQEALDRIYLQNSKPPRHVREHLSKSTGLDMRVVQVWFQNRRAKDKRTQRQIRNRKYEKNEDQYPF